MYVLPQRELPRHEANLDKRPHAIVQQSVIDLVHIRKVVNRIALLIFVVNADLVVQNVVEPHIAEVGDFLHFAKVAAIALPQRKNCASRAEHLLPEVRKWLSRCAGIHDYLVKRDHTLRNLPASNSQRRGNEQND